MIQDDLFAIADVGDEQPQAAGQWLHQQMTLAELRAALRAALAGLPGVPELARAAFAQAIAECQAELDRQGGGEGGQAQRIFSGCRVQGLPWSGTVLAELLTRCEQGDMPGAELRFRRQSTVTTWAVHVPGVGTLELRRWTEYDGMTATYAPWRTTTMLPSYRDCPRVALPYAVWRGAVSVQALAEASDGIASVRTFAHGGRDYTITGVLYGRQMEADAWAIVPRQFWSGTTYTRDELHAAYDAGDIERGNHRGHLVKVRGLVCVLEAMSLFHDASAALRLD
jgi:hypothetical protein